MASNRMTSDGMVSIAFNEIIATMQNEPLRMNVSEWTPQNEFRMKIFIRRFECNVSEWTSEASERPSFRSSRNWPLYYEVYCELYCKVYSVKVHRERYPLSGFVFKLTGVHCVRLAFSEANCPS